MAFPTLTGMGVLDNLKRVVAEGPISKGGEAGKAGEWRPPRFGEWLTEVQEKEEGIVKRGEATATGYTQELGGGFGPFILLGAYWHVKRWKAPMGFLFEAVALPTQNLAGFGGFLGMTLEGTGVEWVFKKEAAAGKMSCTIYKWTNGTKEAALVTVTKVAISAKDLVGAVIEGGKIKVYKGTTKANMVLVENEAKTQKAEGATALTEGLSAFFIMGPNEGTMPTIANLEAGGAAEAEPKAEAEVHITIADEGTRAITLRQSLGKNNGWPTAAEGFCELGAGTLIQVNPGDMLVLVATQQAHCNIATVTSSEGAVWTRVATTQAPGSTALNASGGGYLDIWTCRSNGGAAVTVKWSYPAASGESLANTNEKCCAVVADFTNVGSPTLKTSGAEQHSSPLELTVIRPSIGELMIGLGTSHGRVLPEIAYGARINSAWTEDVGSQNAVWLTEANAGATTFSVPWEAEVPEGINGILAAFRAAQLTAGEKSLEVLPAFPGVCNPTQKAGYA